MGLFSRLFSRRKACKESNLKQDYIQEVIMSQNEKKGIVTTQQTQIDESTYHLLRQRYIALDVETTGLNPYDDRIIEIGAILYENGIPVKRFGTLVNAKVTIPFSAMEINHITNEMIQSAPDETKIYKQLVAFLGDALNEKTILCAHNAKFDMDFLSEALIRLGYNACISYVDTLSLSRKYIRGLENYKQGTIAKFFELHNKKAHRAESDAEVCGDILWKLLDIMEARQKQKKIEMEKRKPLPEEMEVCAVIQNIIASQHGSVDLLQFAKKNGYVNIYYIGGFVAAFKFAKKGKYIIIPNNIKGVERYTKEPCPKHEGGSDYIRLFFSSPLDLKDLNQYIFDRYKSAKKSVIHLEQDENYIAEYKSESAMHNFLSESDMIKILKIVHDKDYTIQDEMLQTDNFNRNDVEIYPVNNRVPLEKISNLHNWDKGFEQGYPYWEKGETYREAGDLDKAISLYEKSRFYGYCVPALFESYAMAYHKLKDYDNEIDILNEGIERERVHGISTSRLVTQRNKAIQMLIKKREKMDRDLAKSQNKSKSGDNSEVNINRKRQGRPILKMDDELNILQKFETVSDATRETGINSKSIRSAAKGIQKHAGGYVWKYADEYNKSL